MKGQECRSSERLSREGSAQHGQRSSRTAEKGDVWFVLTTQTDALRHVCIYGIHMLSWEIRGQQHQTGIRDANAKKTYMATKLRPRRFPRRCLLLEHPQFLHSLAPFSTCLLSPCPTRSVYTGSTRSQTHPPDRQPPPRACTSPELHQVLKDKGYFILTSTSSPKHACFIFSKNNTYRSHAPLQIARQAALKNSTGPRACWFGVWFPPPFLFFCWGCFC